MPVYSIKEFSDLTGLLPKNVHTYASRGKLVKNKNSQIDTANPINEAFYEMRKSGTTKQVKTPKKKAKKEPIAKEKAQPTYKSTKEDAEPEPEQTEIDFSLPTAANILKVEYAKKQKDLEKVEKDILLKEEELRRKRGEVIDTQQTVVLIKSYSENLKKDYIQKMQRLVQSICLRHDVNSDKAGEYKMKIVADLNDSNTVSINALLKKIADE